MWWWWSGRSWIVEWGVDMIKIYCTCVKVKALVGPEDLSWISEIDKAERKN